MANIYITDETKANLDLLAAHDSQKRSTSAEIDYLVSKEMKIFNIPEAANSSVAEQTSTGEQASQGQN